MAAGALMAGYKLKLNVNSAILDPDEVTVESGSSNNGNVEVVINDGLDRSDVARALRSLADYMTGGSVDEPPAAFTETIDQLQADFGPGLVTLEADFGLGETTVEADLDL